jgi:hypothetical protein
MRQNTGIYVSGDYFSCGFSVAVPPVFQKWRRKFIISKSFTTQFIHIAQSPVSSGVQIAFYLDNHAYRDVLVLLTAMLSLEGHYLCAERRPGISLLPKQMP